MELSPFLQDSHFLLFLFKPGDLKTRPGSAYQGPHDRFVGSVGQTRESDYDICL